MELIRRWYQAEGVQATFDYMNDHRDKGDPLVAMPTGTGKSFVIADTIMQMFRYWPYSRALMLVHDKRLIAQNYATIKSIWPNAPVGIFSAGLKKKETTAPITFAGVKSIANYLKAEEKAGIHPDNGAFAKINVIFIDECHLLSPDDDTTYQYVIRRLKLSNPAMRKIGYSATHWRMRMGLITDGGLFDDIAYNITGRMAFNRLIDEGFLAMLVPKSPQTIISASGSKLSKGDINLTDFDDNVSDARLFEAVQELVWHGREQNRRSWTLFAPTIKRVEMINAMLVYLGVASTFVHSKVGEKLNDTRIDAFKAGTYQAIVNQNMLTIGFDCPWIDLIGMFRPTLSTGLWVQMNGRGTRISPLTGKVDCLVLDFVENTLNLGPINDPVIPKRAGGVGDAPVRICPQCKCYNHATAKFCFNCKLEFTFTPAVAEFNASVKPLIVGNTREQKIENWPVQYVTYVAHKKNGGDKPTLRVTYYCGGSKVDEWVCIEHEGFMRQRAATWWKDRTDLPMPATVEEAVKIATSLRRPSILMVDAAAKYPVICSITW